MKRNKTIHTICIILVLSLLTSIVAFAAPQKETSVAINNIKVVGWMEGVEKPSVGSATLWQGKTYATVTATFRYNGKVMTDIAYFYP